MLCLMYDFFSATTRTIYLVIVSNNTDCSWRFFLYQVLTSEKVDYIFRISKLLVKTLFQIKGKQGEQQRTPWWSSIMSCVPSIVNIL